MIVAVLVVCGVCDCAVICSGEEQVRLSLYLVAGDRWPAGCYDDQDRCEYLPLKHATVYAHIQGEHCLTCIDGCVQHEACVTSGHSDL